MRKYPVSATNCTGAACRPVNNPFVIRPITETYTDYEEECCDRYERDIITE